MCHFYGVIRYTLQHKWATKLEKYQQHGVDASLFLNNKHAWLQGLHAAVEQVSRARPRSVQQPIANGKLKPENQIRRKVCASQKSQQLCDEKGVSLA